MEENIINNWIKTYLIGAMEKTGAKDEGVGWRSKLRPELQKRVDQNGNSIYVFDPTLHEEKKTGYSTKEAHKKMDGWIASGNIDKVRECMDFIWRGKSCLKNDPEAGEDELVHVLGDIDYVRNSNFIILHIEQGDKPCVAKGTKILMADWTQKNIEDIKKGDVILGFQKEKGKTKLIKTKVHRSEKSGFKKCKEIIDDNKNKIFTTEDHEFLTPNKKYGSIYKKISDITNVFSLAHVIQDINFLKGWITGYLQHDGCFYESWKKHQITALSDKKNEILKVKEVLEELNFTPNFRKVNRKNKIYYEVSINKFIEYLTLKDWKNNHLPNKNFKCGWLSGSIDADGYYEKESIRYTQSVVHKNNIEIFEKYCTILEIPYNIQVRSARDIYIDDRKLNSNDEITICVSKTKVFKMPSKLKYKQNKFNLTLHNLKSNINIKNSYKKEVYDLTTTTGNFIANGFIISNCGTYAEAFLAFERKIPIYVIRNGMAMNKYNKSLIGWVLGSGGDFFPNQTQLLDFLDKKYKLKVKK